MTTTDQQSANFNRAPRVPIPAFPGGMVNVPPPPTLPSSENQQSSSLMLASMMGLFLFGGISILIGLLIGQIISILFGVVMLLGASVNAFVNVRGQRAQKRQREQARIQTQLDYLRALEQCRAQLQAARYAQLGHLYGTFPNPDQWLDIVLNHEPKLWERRPDDDDFAHYRIGLGTLPLAVDIQRQQAITTNAMQQWADELVNASSYISEAPITASLSEDVGVGFVGKRPVLMQTIRSVVSGLVVAHAPADLQIYVVAPPSRDDDWHWMTWLPHTSSEQRGDHGDLIAFEANHIRNLMGSLGQAIDQRRETKQRFPHLLLIVDDPQLVENEVVFSSIMQQGEGFGASVITLANSRRDLPSDCGAVTILHDDGSFTYTRIHEPPTEINGYSADQLASADATHLARALCATIMRNPTNTQRTPHRVDFLELYNINDGDVQGFYDKIAAWWQRPIPKGHLPFPVRIGRESLITTTDLALDEDNHGPHGVLAGTTGAGKSELLQTLVCSLVLEHHPLLLNLLLIDFKGGSTFNLFQHLPHTVGTVTNLDSLLVDRTLEALKAETRHRQVFLDQHNVRDITQFHKHFVSDPQRLNMPDFTPLPHLVIVVDEFAQLAKEMPDFLHELVRTVQVGRSLGLHLLLGTQSPMDVVTDEMNANLQFRICLRVQNADASRAMLKRPDAAYLPKNRPGRGFLQVGERGLFKEFQTAYVGAEYNPAEATRQAESTPELQVITSTGQHIDLIERPTLDTNLDDEIGEPYTVAKAVCAVISDYTATAAIPYAPPILLPPLVNVLALDEILADKLDLAINRDTDLWQRESHRIPIGSVPVGILDDVFERTQPPLWLNCNVDAANDLTQTKEYRDGHVLIMGGPGTGKTTFMGTLALSQALLHRPSDVHMYFLNFTGTDLDVYGKLPHAESVIHANEEERIRRLFGRLEALLDERQALSEAAQLPIVLLFIDQWEQFNEAYRDTHRASLERIIAEGRASNIFAIIAANSPANLPDRLRSLIQQRIALQLGSPLDYLVAVGRVRKAEDTVLNNGRGFFAGNPPLLVQLALPHLAGLVHPEAEDSGIEQMVAHLADRYVPRTGETPRPIEELPINISLSSLHHVPPAPTGHPLPRQNADGVVQLRTVLGQRDDDALSLYGLDWSADGPHYLVVGSPGSGKTTLLQTAVLSAARRYSPQECRFLLVDMRGRSLSALDDLQHVIARVTTQEQFDEQIDNLIYDITLLGKSDTTNAQTIPATVLMIDDYELMLDTLGGYDPPRLRELRKLLQTYSHLGLHVWIAGYFERQSDALARQVAMQRTGFAMTTRDSLTTLMGRTILVSNQMMPEGRAYVPKKNAIDIVQIAQEDDLPALIAQLNGNWKSDRATWRYQRHPGVPASPTPPASAPAPSSPTSPPRIDVAGLMGDLLGQSNDVEDGDGS